jgi:hypothetical protein
MFDFLNQLNQSKYFLAFLIIFLNLGSKFINININDYHKRILHDTIGRELMIFAICFVGTRDVITALIMSSAFIIINDFMFNEDSSLCIIPKGYRNAMRSALDKNKDDVIDESEIKDAIQILNKARKQKQQEIQRAAYMTFMNNV